MESYVVRPITRVPPMVVALKCAKSSGIRHGMPPCVADHAVVGVRRDERDVGQTAMGALMPGCGS